MKRFASAILIVFAVMFIGAILLMVGGLFKFFGVSEQAVSQSSVLEMELDGIIFDVSEFTENLRKYSKKDAVKGVLLKINSPGGVVGPSQEIYQILRHIRDELKKPVVVTSSSVLASGAYYASAGASRIVTNSGTMVGSIGVIMEFANLKGLYDWAKIDRYSIKTGAYKGAGADYRPMSKSEKDLFQSLVDEVQEQFETAIIDGRQMRPDVVEKYSDGRVFTGATAAKLGFTDQVGTYSDALKLLGELTGLGDEPEIFSPPKKRERFLDYFMEALSEFNPMSTWSKHFARPELLAQPLYLMPGVM